MHPVKKTQVELTHAQPVVVGHVVDVYPSQYYAYVAVVVVLSVEVAQTLVVEFQAQFKDDFFVQSLEFNS